MDTHIHSPTLANSQTVPTGGFSRREILLIAAAASKPLDQAEDGAGHRYCTRHERAVFLQSRIRCTLFKNYIEISVEEVGPGETHLSPRPSSLFSNG